MLREQLKEAMKVAMKEKDTVSLSAIRLILASIKDRDIADRSNGNDDGIDNTAILSLLTSMIKQRRDSIELYKKGGREDLVNSEMSEIKVIERFLPKQLEDDEVKAAISSAIKESGAESIKDMGRIMAVLKEKYAGQMDFSKASGLVKQQLS